MMMPLVPFMRPRPTHPPAPAVPAGVFAALLAVLVTLAGTAVLPAAEPAPPAAPVPDQPAQPPAADDPAVQARLPGCAVWTDRCVTCTRVSGGTSCSNIGIACQPQAVECLRSESAEDQPAGQKKQEN